MIRIITVVSTADYQVGQLITFPCERHPWHRRLRAWLLCRELPPEEIVYHVVGVPDDHTLAVEEFP